MRKRLILLMFSAMILTGCGNNNLSDNSTTEEIIAYENSITREYEVVSVSQYLDTKTNTFGMITEQELKFEFTYIDELGQLITYDSFEDTEYGLTCVCVGEENKYVVKDFGVNVYRTLYVTENDLKYVY